MTHILLWRRNDEDDVMVVDMGAVTEMEAAARWRDVLRRIDRIDDAIDVECRDGVTYRIDYRDYEWCVMS